MKQNGIDTNNCKSFYISLEIMLLVVLRKCNLNFIRNKNWTAKASQHAIQHHAGHYIVDLRLLNSSNSMNWARMTESAPSGCYIAPTAGRRSGTACTWMWKIIQRSDRIRHDFDWHFDVPSSRLVMDVVQGVDFCITLIVPGVVDNGDISSCWLVVSIIQGSNFWRCLPAWSFVDYTDFSTSRSICFVI